MSNNIKLLLVFCFLILIGGFAIYWFSINSTKVSISTPVPSTTTDALPSSKIEIQGIEGELVLVTKVIDGDTIEIAGGQHVRLIGVDTPETVDPRRPVGCYGKEASNEVKKLLEGKQVILEADVEDMDHYKRLLRYVYLSLPDGNQLFITDYLVREGFGRALNIPPDVKYEKQLYEAQNQARSLKKGLWGNCQPGL